MNPDALTDQFDLYLAVLETGSFSAAARRLQLTPSSVARRIDALEKAMGCVLVARNTHAVRATAAGLAFAERARRILAELRQARAEAVSLSSAPEGLIRIDAPAPFGRRHLAPAIADFLTLYPGLDVQLRLIDSFVDLHGDHLGEVDLVLRIGPLADTRLVATPLASMTRILCASPSTSAVAACCETRANCRSTTAWTGTRCRRLTPGASKSRVACNCCARGA